MPTLILTVDEMDAVHDVLRDRALDLEEDEADANPLHWSEERRLVESAIEKIKAA